MSSQRLNLQVMRRPLELPKGSTKCQAWPRRPKGHEGMGRRGCRAACVDQEWSILAGPPEIRWLWLFGFRSEHPTILWLH